LCFFLTSGSSLSLANTQFHSRESSTEDDETPQKAKAYWGRMYFCYEDDSATFSLSVVVIDETGFYENETMKRKNMIIECNDLAFVIPT
jgi:thymidine kinase